MGEYDMFEHKLNKVRMVVMAFVIHSSFCRFYFYGSHPDLAEFD